MYMYMCICTCDRLGVGARHAHEVGDDERGEEATSNGVDHVADHGGQVGLRGSDRRVGVFMQGKPSDSHKW